MYGMRATQGIIFQRQDFRERDERVVLYTRDSGKISLIAKGTKRIEAKLRGNLDLLNLVDIIFVEGAYFPILTGVELRDRFPALAKDASLYSAALSIARIVTDVFGERQKDEDFFDSLRFTIQKLGKFAKDPQPNLYPWLLLKKFEILVLESQGHAPSFTSSGMSKNALQLVGMLRGQGHFSVRVTHKDLTKIEDVLGKMFAYFFNYRIPSWTPVAREGQPHAPYT